MLYPEQLPKSGRPSASRRWYLLIPLLILVLLM